MLTHAGCQARRQRLWDAVGSEVEWILVGDPRHVHYFSNFWIHPLSFSAGERCLLLLERNGRATLFADNFARRSAASEPYVDDERIQPWYDHQHSVINRDTILLAELGDFADELADQTGMIEAEAVSASVCLAFDVYIPEDEDEEDDGEDAETLGDIIRDLRRNKEPDEIELLKRCMAACAAGHARAREVIKPGITELDVYREVQSAAVAAAECPALVYGDFRCTSPSVHKAGGLPTNHVLADGELFILDYSVVIDGYRSDFTNTKAVGTPSAEQAKAAAACIQAIESGEKKLRAGASASDIYDTCSAELDAAGIGPLKHHAGHGLGLGHPEPPILVPQSTDTLEAGDVITLEPGVYLEGVGGMRFEHNYLITENGFERLSEHELGL